MKRIQSLLSSKNQINLSTKIFIPIFHYKKDLSSNPVPLLLIDDSSELDSSILIEYLLPKISKNSKELNYLLFETSPFYFKTQIVNQALRKKKNVIFDFFLDPLGWENKGSSIEQSDNIIIHQYCPLNKIDDISKSINKNHREKDRKNHNLITPSPYFNYSYRKKKHF